MFKHISSLALLVTLSATSVFADDIKLLSQADLNWETSSEGVAFAPLHGDRFKTTYQAMVRLPAGIVSPPHVKSANMYGVILQGEMIHYSKDGNSKNAKRVGVGSFYHIPKDLPHVSACVSAKPCVAYLYQDGAFDFVPVTK